MTVAERTQLEKKAKQLEVLQLQKLAEPAANLMKDSLWLIYQTDRNRFPIGIQQAVETAGRSIPTSYQCLKQLQKD